MPRTDDYEGMLAETITIEGHGGDDIRAYYARPLGAGPAPGVVLVHHAPGWDEWYKEAARTFAYHGYAAICPNLYERVGHGTVQEVGAKVREQGGVPDADVVGDLVAARDYIRRQPYLSGRVGLIGSCSGGRHAFLTACQTTGWDATVELWGGGVVMAESDLSDKRPVAPIDLTADLCSPLLGLFGNEDKSPTAAQVDQHEAELKRLGKEYEFHRYDGAGHGFFYHHTPLYRQEQAVDGWAKVWDFFGRHLT